MTDDIETFIEQAEPETNVEDMLKSCLYPIIVCGFISAIIGVALWIM